MIFAAYFHHVGTPKTALTPQITAYDLTDGTTPLAGVAMTEVGNGWYKYDYAAGDEAHHYVFIVDSVALSGLERYGDGEWLPNRLTATKAAYLDAAVSGVAASVWEVVIENALKAKHLLSCALAYIANIRTGGGTAALVYRNNADDTDRIKQTVNEVGEVSASTIDVSDIP